MLLLFDVAKQIKCEIQSLTVRFISWQTIGQ